MTSFRRSSADMFAVVGGCSEKARTGDAEKTIKVDEVAGSKNESGREGGTADSFAIMLR
jgi:hypothetical protein